MAVLEKGTFENLSPSRFISFTFPNPHPNNNSYTTPLLRIALLDSPLLPTTPLPKIAALLVPKDREDDWIFSTDYGHFQLLFNSPNISRLILIGNLPTNSPYPIYNHPKQDNSSHLKKFEEKLIPLLFALSPKISFQNGLFPNIPFVSYQDNVIRSVLVETFSGSDVGDFLVEDVEIDLPPEKESDQRLGLGFRFRRRLRFKRIPNLVQTQIPILPFDTSTVNLGLGQTEFRPETGFLVQPYLPPMVASLSLVASILEERIRSGLGRPRVLCIGVGGGALLTFLRTRFEFDILGVEVDEMVLMVARKYFGLVEDEFVRVRVGNGIQMLKDFARQSIHCKNSDTRCNSENVDITDLWYQWNSDFNGDVIEDLEEDQLRDRGNFQNGEVGNSENEGCLDSVDGGGSLIHVIMIDLDSGDAKNGLSAPPLEFIDKSVLLAARLALHERGVLAINVIPPSKSFYDGLVRAFKEFFSELYELDVGNGENFVLIATASPVGCVVSESGNSVMETLRQVVDDRYMNQIQKI
ncbi:S-adenosyl-L-methionine-dependent methyltransferases superfamily protein [Tasmannia lanceolata]|uniref:S-adenosyl-L-methionine-dependent methyltransferases superfamily protein n=1 Tax=Tasmannia lanceolata TaxID=3420 RepID=UPI0040631019